MNLTTDERQDARRRARMQVITLADIYLGWRMDDGGLWLWLGATAIAVSLVLLVVFSLAAAGE